MTANGETAGLRTRAAKSRAKERNAAARIELTGGALCFVETARALPLVHLSLSLFTGSAHDPTGKDGLARTTVRMLRRGAGAMSASDLEDEIDRLGGELAIEVSASSMTLYGQVIRRSFGAFVDLIAKLVGEPTLATDELARLKREAIAELEEARDNDRALAQVAFRRAVFPGHAYGRGAAGRPSTIAAMEREDVAAFHATHFVRGNALFGFAGDVSSEEARQAAERILGALGSAAAPSRTIPPPARLDGRSLAFVDKPERTQTQIVIGGMGTSAHDADHTDLAAATAIFGGTFTSRLMREVRSKRGWSYGASARIAIERQRHAFSMWTFPAANDAAQCVALELELLGAWIERGVTKREVGFIKRYLERSYAFDVDTAAKRLQQVLDVELLALPPDYYTGYLDRVARITHDTASAAVSARISTNDLAIVVVGTATEIEERVRAEISSLARHEIIPFDRE